MRKISVLFLAMACLLMLAGCSSCEHEWANADCVNPYTCIQCDETVGTPLGHDWEEADCTSVRTCARCGRTEGDPVGHTWQEADCTKPKICTTCGEIVGEALGHTWAAATAQAPATCTVCGATDGEKIQTDARFVTESAQPLFGRWEMDVAYGAEELKVEGFEGKLEGIYFMEFDNAGNMKSGFELRDEKAFRDAMIKYYTDWYLATLEEEELDLETANAVANVLVGMNVEAYARYMIEEMSVEEVTEALLEESALGGEWSGEYLYYVDGESLYWDYEWSDEMYSSSVELIGTKLMLDEYMEFTKVTAE